MASSTISPLMHEIPTASFSAAAAADMLASSVAEPEHNQITFEIPSHRDLEHIDALHSFNTLLQRIGNVAYNTVASSAAAAAPVAPLAPINQVFAPPLGIDAAGHRITNEQISKSVVLNLADLKNNAANGLERFFAGADMHSIINYLWIGVVSSLVILSVIFIVFSCYFYRKFREWKKCNKDIRSHLNNDIYPGGTIVACDNFMASGETAEATYYQMESPPCYTIATGLPSYDEALHHQHQHFSYGMKFMYPTIAAVHHHPSMAGGHIVSNWEKEELTLRYKEKQHQQQKQQQQKQKALKLAGALDVSPAYDAAASVALLAAAAPEKTDAISICMDEAATETDADVEVGALAAYSTATVAATVATATDPHDEAGNGAVVVVIA